jgi:hypothetical protein
MRSMPATLFTSHSLSTGGLRMHDGRSPPETYTRNSSDVRPGAWA